MSSSTSMPHARPAAATRDRIINAAERLCAVHGIEAVSLRQIGVAAGAANHFAVQYHFGDKAGLIRAIFERRLPSLDARRAFWLDKVKRAGRDTDPTALMEVLLRPLSEEVDDKGTRSYAAFLLGLFRNGGVDARMDASDLAPLTSQLADLMHAANSGVPLALSRMRLTRSYILFADALAEIDRRGTDGFSGEEEYLLIDDAIAMAAAAFTAPVPARARQEQPAS